MKKKINSKYILSKQALTHIKGGTETTKKKSKTDDAVAALDANPYG